jgi:GntR family transcriptional regulator
VEFKTNKDAIYLQIANHISEKILREEWRAGDKIPSIRDLAIEIVVNPNTAARSYEYLESQGVIYTQRGIGYFVTPDAHQKIIALKKSRFLQDEAPIFFKSLRLLNIDFTELEEMYKKFQD